MSGTKQPDSASLRMDAKDLKRHIDAGQAVEVLDVRAPQAWKTSRERITGDIRIPPDQFKPDPSWPKDRLTVAYCT